MRRYAYGGERTAEVHAEAEGRALGPLEERSMYSRHCASAREKEQERRVPRIGFEWRHYPSSTSAGAHAVLSAEATHGGEHRLSVAMMAGARDLECVCGIDERLVLLRCRTSCSDRRWAAQAQGRRDIRAMDPASIHEKAKGRASGLPNARPSLLLDIQRYYGATGTLY